MDQIDAMHKKIGRLQLKLTDFTEQTSPSKEKGFKKSLESNEPIQEHKLRKERKPRPHLKKYVLTSLCFIVLFIVPVMVYTIEGYSSFFWPATGFSTIASVLLLLYLTSRIPIMMSGFHKARSKVRIVVQDTEYFSNRRRIQCTLLIAMILFGLCLGNWVDGSNRYLYNFCLLAVGYTAGILSVNLYGFCMQSKRLPYHSPLHKKREELGPAKRELDFSSAALTASPGLSPMDCFRPSPDRDTKCGELIHRGPLPVPPLPPPLKPSPSKQKRSYSPFH